MFTNDFLYFFTFFNFFKFLSERLLHLWSAAWHDRVAGCGGRKPTTTRYRSWVRNLWSIMYNDGSVENDDFWTDSQSSSSVDSTLARPVLVVVDSGRDWPKLIFSACDLVSLSRWHTVKKLVQGKKRVHISCADRLVPTANCVCQHKAYITVAIRLRSNYDVGYCAHLLPFDASRREQKMNMSVFCRRRVVVS